MRLVTALLCLLLLACPPRSTDDDTSGGSPTPTASAEPTPTATLPEVESDCRDGQDNDADGGADCVDEDCANDPICLAAACADEFIGSVMGSPAHLGDTNPGGAGTDDQVNGCGGASFDRTLAWIAPQDGIIAFASRGVSPPWSTSIAVRDGSCSGAELGCTTDLGVGGSLTRVQVRAGQLYVIVVDGSSITQSGAYELAIEAANLNCPDRDLGSTTGTPVLSGNTASARDDFVGSCGGASSRDRSYTFTAASPGTHTFDTYGSAFDTVLYVLDGACVGAELGCNNDTLVLQSELSLSLAAGQQVTVVIDGTSPVATGDFDLNITGP
jgi:hypothetical protein